MIDLYELHGKTFAGHLHSLFNVDAGGPAPLALRLIAVNEPSTPPNIELFSLVFAGPVSPRLAQQTFRVEHAKIGTFQLFLTAIAGDSDGITYEAIFHRLVKKKP
jgi:hypothetical protein